MKTTMQKFIFFIIAFLGLGLHGNASSSEHGAYDPNLPVPASHFVNLCSSSDADKLAFCEGYIASVTHDWKRLTACKSPLKKIINFVTAPTRQEINSAQ